MEVNMRGGVEQLKAIPGFDARCVFITPPSLDVSETHISMETAGIYEPLRRLLVEWDIARVPEEVEEAELEYSRVPGVYDLILPSENLYGAIKTLVYYTYGSHD